MKNTKRLIVMLLITIFMISMTNINLSVSAVGTESTSKRQLNGSGKGLYWYSDTLTKTFSSGSGTETDPYIIKTPAELRLAIMDGLNGVYYKLGNDIAINDTSSSDWYNGSDLKNWIKGSTNKDKNSLEMSSNSNSGFRGKFDGAGYTISGLYINYDGSGEWAKTSTALGSGFGLFPHVYYDASIKNLRLKDVYIRSKTTDITEKHCYGALIGTSMATNFNIDNIVIENVKMELNRTTTLNKTLSSKLCIGGVIGYAHFSNYFNLSNIIVKNFDVKVDGSYATSKQDRYIGSIMGFPYSSTKLNFKNIISIGDTVPFSTVNSKGAENGSKSLIFPNRTKTLENVWAIGNTEIASSMSETKLSSLSDFISNSEEFYEKLGEASVWEANLKCHLPMLSLFKQYREIAHGNGTPATCKEFSKCEVCNMPVGNTLDANNHTGEAVYKNGQKATCDTIGHQGDVYCADCNTRLSAGQSVDAIGHNYSKWVVTKKSTELTEGEKYRICSTCNHKDVEAIEKLPKTDSNTPNKKPVVSEKPVSKPVVSQKPSTEPNNTDKQDLHEEIDGPIKEMKEDISNVILKHTSVDNTLVIILLISIPSVLLILGIVGLILIKKKFSKR